MVIHKRNLEREHPDFVLINVLDVLDEEYDDDYLRGDEELKRIIIYNNTIYY